MDKKIYRCPVRGVVHAGMLSLRDDEEGNDTDVHIKHYITENAFNVKIKIIDI